MEELSVYVLTWAATQQGLVDAVCDWVRKGYIPAGGAFCSPDGKFNQAMVLSSLTEVF